MSWKERQRLYAEIPPVKTRRGGASPPPQKRLAGRGKWPTPPRPVAPPQPPRWTSDEEARLRTLVGELGGEKWKTIAERLGTGRTGHAVEQKWAKLKAKDAAALLPPPVAPAPAAAGQELPPALVPFGRGYLAAWQKYDM